MESDEMQATDKAEIVNRYRSLLTDFWKTDSRFSAQTLATEEKKKSDTNSAKNEYDSTDRSLLHRKNSDLDRIQTEESSIKNSTEEKRNKISESAKTTKDALHEIAFGHFVNLSDDRNIQIESNIDLDHALDGLVSKTQRSANRIKDEIDDYKKWKANHSAWITTFVGLGILVVFFAVIFGKKELDVYGIYKSGKELYQQKAYLGAIEKFEALKTNSSIFMGNTYYQRIQSLLDTCYYNSAIAAIEKGELEKADTFLNKLSQKTNNYYRDLRKEINYQGGALAMKRKDWTAAVSYLLGVDRSYKSTAQFLNECYWQNGIKAMQKKEWSNAIGYFKFIDGNYEATTQYIKECESKLRDEMALRYGVATEGSNAQLSSDSETIASNKNNVLQLKENIEQPSERISPARFRNKPDTLSSAQVQMMLQRNEFFCTDYLNKTTSNPQGRGFANDFKKLLSGKVIVDRASGLTWQQAGSDETMTYAEVEKYIRTLNMNKFAGYDDWHLPTLEEGMSLMEPNKANDYLYIDLIFDKKQSIIWTADRSREGSVWVADFRRGHCIRSRVTNGHFVRVVRISVGQTDHSKTAQPEKITPMENKRPFRDKPARLSIEEVKTMLVKYGFYHGNWNNNGKGVRHRYESEIIAGDKVVHDEASGLMWQQSCSSNDMPYAEVKKYIDDLNAKKFAGYSDWRLPTLEEAMSLMEPKENANGMYLDPKFDSANWLIWTSDTYSAWVAWVVLFNHGYCYHYPVTHNHYVRVVR